MFGPIIEGERVRLAPMTKAQIENFVLWMADPEVTRWLGITHAPTVEMEHEWYERVSKAEKDFVWGIFIGDKHIGSTGVHQIDWRNRHGVTGNLIGDKTEWGKGYGSEVVALRTVSPCQGRSCRCAATMTHSSRSGCQRCSHLFPALTEPRP